MPQEKKLETTVILYAQDCTPHGEVITPEECEAIAEVFTLAAAELRKQNYGIIICKVKGEILVEFGIDYNDIPFNEEKGLPVLHQVKIKKRGK